MAVVSAMTRGNLGSTGLFHLTLSYGNPSLKEVKADTETETMEEFCLLACSPWLVQPAFPRAVRTTSPEVALPTLSWVFPHQSLFKKMLPRLAVCQSDRTLFFNVGSYSQIGPS